MDYLFPPDLEKALTVFEATPPYTQEFLLPYADAVFKEGPFGWLLTQEVPGTGFNFSQHIFNVIDPIQLTVSVKEPCTTLTYVMQGEASYKLNGHEEVIIEEGYYYIFYIPSGSHSLQLEKGTYVIVQIELSPSLLRKLSLSYYAMYEGEKSMAENNPEAYLLDSPWISPAIWDVLKRMLYCTRDEDERALDLEARVLDLLLLYTEDNGQNEKVVSTRSRFTPEEINRIIDAGNLKKERMGLTLKELAKKANMHPKKLEAGFKEVFGKNAKEFTADIKMEAAKDLLKNTSKSISEIAFEVEYGDASTFTRAFKRYVGVTPLAYRNGK